MFCLGEEQGMFVNDECSSWCNRLDFMVSGWNRRKEILWQWISRRGQLNQPHSKLALSASLGSLALSVIWWLNVSDYQEVR